MLKDITIGQYFPGQSVIHRLDPRTKIILTLVYIVMLFTVSNSLGFLLGISFIVAAYLISKVPIRMIAKSIKPIIPIVIFTAILNLFFVNGTVLWEFWVIRITYEGIRDCRVYGGTHYLPDCRCDPFNLYDFAN